RVGPDQDSNHQGQRKSPQHFPTKNVQRKHGQKGEAGGKNGPAQGLVDALVDDVGQGLAAQQLNIFADAIEDDDSVVHRIADQREDGGNHRQADFLVQQREEAHGDNGVVDASDN